MALDKMVFKEDEVERLQTKIRQVSQDTNRLYLQLRGQTNNWGGIPLGSDLIRAQTLINELTVEAEKLEDIIRLAVKGVQGAQDENKRQANQLFQQLGTLGGIFGKLGGGSASGQFPIPTYAQKMVTNLITSVAALMGRDELNSDPLVQKLQTTVKNSGLGTIDSIAAHSKLKDIYQARDQIAKAQTAYKVYQAFGNKTQMDAMHKLAEDARQKLKYLGIDEVHYQAGKDLSGYFKKPVVKACDYDPSITSSSVPLVQNESYLLMLRMAMEPGDQGAWAKRQLVGERLNIPPMELPDGTPITAYNNENEITLNYFNAHVLKPNETNSLSAYYLWLESTYGMTEWRKKVVQADAVTRAFVGSLIEETVMGVVDTVTFTFHFVIDPEKTTQEMADTASYIMQHPQVLAEAAKKMYHNFNEGTPEEKASMLGAAASVLVPGLSVTKGTKVGKVADGVQDFATKAMEGVKDLNKVLQNSGHLAEFPKFKPFLSTSEGVPFSVGKIPLDSNPLPKTFVQEHYINEMNGFGDVKGGKIEGTGKKTGKLELSDFTDEIMNTKPMNSPVPKKWYDKGGTILLDKSGTWTYTNKEGISVSYPNGYPDFSAYYHPTVKPVPIEVTVPKNPQEDFKKANLEAGLNKDSDPPVPASNKPPEGYSWHHHEDGKTMILVDEDIHREFRHIGGQSTVNGKNKKGE
ncbi:HNH endonuclease [Paenibacillus sp. FSL K6-3166]|uniref:HNH endonuclease n=1 Tax=Paenibacillus sp. FSL K6-3166 TaxID=2921492 RepID=UPI0030F9E412